MAFKTLTIKESVYRKIAAYKEPGESFSEVLEREFAQKITTIGELKQWAKACAGRKTGLTQRKPAKGEVA